MSYSESLVISIKGIYEALFTLRNLPRMKWLYASVQLSATKFNKHVKLRTSCIRSLYYNYCTMLKTKDIVQRDKAFPYIYIHTYIYI